MPRWWIVPALLFMTASPAAATTGGPNAFEVLGFEKATKRLYLKEDVGGESGAYRIWVFDYGKRTAPKITAYEYGDADTGMDSIPKSLEAAPRLPASDLTFGGEIVKQGLTAIDEFLIPSYELKISAAWRGSTGSARIVAYRTPEARVVESYAVDERCALVIVSALGRPYETGYQEQTPILICRK
jgi:hypothetical protein